ncbi:MAG: VCBS repeat-containing protein, partial [Flavobacteriaceae bacterium]|nr:VCBS repeat-containing protein [Flavobacteriaceae bacterium]
MKKIFIMFLWGLMQCAVMSAQFGSQQIIADDADGTQSLFVADLDGDNLKDVVSANRFGNNVSWYKHMDGQGQFGPAIEISNISEPKKVYVADLDGDSDMDILAISLSSDALLWFENVDGLGSFDVSHGIYDGESVGVGAFSTTVGDLDGDDDLDVILASNFNGLSWFENLDGLGDFGPRQVISEALTANRSVFATDIDGDLDIDLVTNSSGSNNLFWFENIDGLGNFNSGEVVAPTTTYPNDVFGADLDGDNDMDIITATPAADLVAWHENLDGQGTFGPEQVITDQAVFAISVYAADLDNDDDMDVISASANDNKIAWYENLDGEGGFSAQQIISTDVVGPVFVFAADLDNDTDMDVLSASQNDDKLAWYENTTIAGVEDNRALAVRLVPNPVDDLLTIQSREPITRLTVYGVRGEKVMER